MKNILACATLIMAAAVFAAEPFDTGFKSGNIADCLEAKGLDQAKVLFKDVDVKKVLSISNGATASFIEIPVEPRTKYTLECEASFSGSEAIEENPRLELFTRPGARPPNQPVKEIMFFDAEGKQAGVLASGLVFRNRTYTDVFYTPAKAVSMKLRLKSPKDVELLVQQPRLFKTSDEGAINVNPEFKLGLCNYSGWGSPAAGGQIVEENGKTVFDTKYGTFSQPFPLKEGGTYALSAKFNGNGYNTCVILHVLNEEGKNIKEISIRGNQTSYFVMPKDAVSGRFLVYSSMLEEVRLNRVGDDSKIDELLKAKK